MPIMVKDYTWEENEQYVHITVPLKGVKANKVDVFLTEEYLKLSYPPYFFEVLLFASVNDKTSTSIVGNGTVLCKLNKKEHGLWNQLTSPDMIDKVKMKGKREEAIKKAQERAEDEKKEKAEKKRQNEKFSLRKAMKIDEDERERIKQAKESEIKKATEELEQWKENQRLQAVQEKQRQIEERVKQQQELDTISNKFSQTELKEKQQMQLLAKVKKGDMFEDKEDTAEINVRKSGKIQVSFTKREFPTAARESTDDAEQEWLRKQAEARKMADIQDADLKDEEKNPVWLKEKGDSFFKTGNFQAAINAYSHAIRMDRHLPGLYSNRAACHLKIGNLIKCIEDCSKALELLTPPVQQNATSRCKAHIRRGTAFCNLELYVEGLQDYEAALKINSDNEQIKKDADKIRTIIQSSSS